jgi:hypothetical protein
MGGLLVATGYLSGFGEIDGKISKYYYDIIKNSTHD